MGIKVPAGYKLPVGTIEQCRNFLQEQTDAFGLFISYDRLMYHISQMEYAMNSCGIIMRNMTGMYFDRELKRQHFIEMLTKRFNVPEYKLMDNNTISINKKVIEGLLADPQSSPALIEFLQVLQQYSQCKGVKSNLTQFTKFELSNMTDEDNERLLCIHPYWNVLSTSRLSSQSPNMQNMSNTVNDIFSAPKGYVLLHPDSGQIEPRITYSVYIRDPLIKHLITAYDDAYYGILHYILMRPEEEVQARANLQSIQLHEINDDIKAKRKRLKVLALAGNYGSKNLDNVDPELGPLYAEKIVKHPERRRLEHEVTEAVQAGVSTFYGYFGTPVDPNNSASADLKRDTPYWRNHVIRCGINNPVQTTAAELMYISMLETQKMLRPDEHVAGWIHDAGLFYVPEDKVEEREDAFTNLMAYDVEGWIPIGAEMEKGRGKSQYVDPVY